MASRIVHVILRIEDITEAGLDLDTVLDGIGAEVDRRRAAGQVGAAPKTVRVSAAPLREPRRGTRRFNYTFQSRNGHEEDEEP
jgi:hypothetical protein